MHVLPNQRPRFGARTLPEFIPSKTLCATANRVWRRKVGLHSIFDPRGIDVTQNAELDSHCSEPDFGWTGERGSAWTQQLEGEPNKFSVNGRLRDVRAATASDLLPSKRVYTVNQDACEDLPRLPWVRTQAVEHNRLQPTNQDLPPAKLRATQGGFLQTTGHRRAPIPGCPIIGHDGLRVSMPNGRPRSLGQLACKRQLAQSMRIAASASSNLQAKLGEWGATDGSTSTPVCTQSTQIEQQNLLSPANGMLDLFGIPFSRPTVQLDSNLAGQEHGQPTKPSMTQGNAESAPHLLLPSKAHTDSDRQQLMYRASALPVPREFGSGNCIAMVTGQAAQCVNTRTDQGRSQGQMMVVSRSAEPRRSGLTFAGLPRPQAVHRTDDVDDYAHSKSLTQRFQSSQAHG